MADFNLRITVRSARIIDAIRDKFGTQMEMSRKTGINHALINQYVTIKNSPIGLDGWKISAIDFATALGLYPSDLWPDHMMEATLKQSTAEMTIDADEVKALIAPEGATAKKFALEKMFEAVTGRQIKAITMHNEGATLDEVGLELGVTRERVRQIILNGYKKMRTKGKALGIKSYDDAC